MLKLQSHGITEDRILYMNRLLESTRYNVDMKPNSKHMLPPNSSFAGKPINSTSENAP
ncbi:MAG: hypothetical protein ACJ71E_07655 [Nitrososphaeraceae archaeon]